MHAHAVAVTHNWSVFSSANLPSNTLYHQTALAHMHTIWPWLSVVSRSADTWKDILERGPFHSNSAQQHLAETRCFTPTVVKGMRVLNSMAAHSSLLPSGGRRACHGHSTPPAAHSHILQSTHSTADQYECKISNLNDRTSGNWR